MSGGIFDWDNAVIRLDEVEHLAQDPDLWNRPEKAQTLMRERTQLTSAIEGVRKLETELSDSIELAELAELEGEDELVDDAVATLQKLATLVEKMRIESLLSGEADSNDCFLEVHAGAGGTESQDWAQMLLRMYTRWADRRGYKVEEMEESPGEEAGIKSATVKISGLNAYGWSKTETGVHRLVRISPYDSQARRHTSFASVGVSPVVDDSMDVELEDKDIRVDTYRASGAGGQHVNKTDSAIRMTHIPTGIAVQCQNSRSQHRNRAEALTMLATKVDTAPVQPAAAPVSEPLPQPVAEPEPQPAPVVPDVAGHAGPVAETSAPSTWPDDDEEPLTVGLEPLDPEPEPQLRVEPRLERDAPAGTDSFRYANDTVRPHQTAEPQAMPRHHDPRAEEVARQIREAATAPPSMPDDNDDEPRRPGLLGRLFNRD